MRNRTGWQYAAVGLAIAAVAAVISYRDGLFVARLAGNHDNQAYLYPFLPDGLIVVCLLALYEASRARVARSRWAMSGLVLGITLTLAQNVYAGLAHSILDAVLDGMVPVVFFIAVEVVLWHVRRGRGAGAQERPPATNPASAVASLPKMREIQQRQGCSPTTAKKIRAELQRFTASSPAGVPHPKPAGASGRDSGVPPAPVPAAHNGHRAAGE